MIWFSRSNNNLSVHQVMPAHFVGASEALYLAWAFFMGALGALTGAAAAMVRDLLRVDGARSVSRLHAARESNIPLWAFAAVLFLIGGGAGVATLFVLWITGIASEVTEPMRILSACVIMGVFAGSWTVGGTIFRDLLKAKRAVMEETGIHAPRREDDKP